MNKQVVVIAGPAGSGKDSIIRKVVEVYPHAVFGLTTTTRAPRPGEVHGINYFFLSKEDFLKGIENGDVPEHYHRAETDTYYGLYKPYLDEQIAKGKIVFYQIQIVGAKYLKEHYDATTFFVNAAIEVLERRIRARAPMSDVEWQERKEITEREFTEEAPWYDYQIVNEEGRLNESVEKVVEILKKEGYTLQS